MSGGVCETVEGERDVGKTPVRMPSHLLLHTEPGGPEEGLLMVVVQDSVSRVCMLVNTFLSHETVLWECGTINA